jgi:hypothetical protein
MTKKSLGILFDIENKNGHNFIKQTKDVLVDILSPLYEDDYIVVHGCEEVMQPNEAIAFIKNNNFKYKFFSKNLYEIVCMLSQITDEDIQSLLLVITNKKIVQDYYYHRSIASIKLINANVALFGLQTTDENFINIDSLLDIKRNNLLLYFHSS